LLYYTTTARNEGAAGTVGWKEVDEGWIRYDHHSGRTLLLTPLARFIIDLLDKSSKPLSALDLVEEVLRAEPDADPDDCHVEVDTVLGILSEGQLIQPVHL